MKPTLKPGTLADRRATSFWEARLAYAVERAPFTVAPLREPSGLPEGTNTNQKAPMDTSFTTSPEA